MAPVPYRFHSPGLRLFPCLLVTGWPGPTGLEVQEGRERMWPSPSLRVLWESGRGPVFSAASRFPLLVSPQSFGVVCSAAGGSWPLAWGLWAALPPRG